MLAVIRKLAFQSLVYGLGGTLAQMVGFFLIPIYTRVLTPEDYGIMAVVATAMGIARIVFDCGVIRTAMRYYNEFEEDERQRFFGSIAVAQFVFTCVVTVAVVASANKIASLLLGSSDSSVYVQLAVARAFLGVAATLPGVFFRMREQPWLVVITSLASLLTDVGLSLYLVLGLRMGLLGVYLGGLLSQAICYPLYAHFLLKDIKLTLQWHHVRPALAFGLPVVPGQLGHWVLNLSDRVLLQRLASTAETGLYSVGYRFGMIMQFVVGTIDSAWMPYFYSLNKRVGEIQAREHIGRLFTYYAVVVGLLGLLIAVFGGDLLRLMAERSFWAAASVIPLIAAAYMLLGLYLMTVNALCLRNKTHLLPAMTGAAAIANVALNLLLIPRMGMMGAAWATLVAFAVLAAVTATVAQRLYPIPFEKARLAKVTGVYVAIWLACQALTPEHTTLVSVISRLGIVVTLPILLGATGFLRPEERTRLRQLLGWASRPK